MTTEVIAVRINVRWRRFYDENMREPQGTEIYDIARWAWRIRPTSQLVFACQDGIIRGVYKVDEWFRCGKARNRPELRPYAPEGSVRWHEIENDIRDNRRHAFIGCPAACADQFIGTNAPVFNPRNPVTHIQVNI